jgi:hypothetical protein
MAALTNPTTYKQFVETFGELCLSHLGVKHFQVGQPSDVDMQTNLETFQRYPFCFLVPENAEMDRFGKFVLTFSFIVADIAKNEEDLQVNTHNETLMIMQDIFSKIIMSPASNVPYEVLTPIASITPFVEAYNNNLAGWTAIFDVQINSPFNLCDAAF